jgi:(2Fe-2S) ferredoxin
VARRRFKIVICRGPECGDCRGSAALAPVFAACLERQAGVVVTASVSAAEAGAGSAASLTSTGGNAAAGDSAGTDVMLEWQSCFGRCSQGPNVLVRQLVAQPEGPRFGTGFATVPGPRGATALYNGVDAEKAERIVMEHVVGGRIIRELIEVPQVALPTTPGETPP